MSKRYLCSRHVEKTPSVQVYHDHAYCYGCNQRIPLDEIGLTASDALREAEYVENIESTLNYIDTLPRKTVRGFSLPVSARGYYLVYPCRTFYKLRVADADAKSKYRGPAGHKKPPFYAQVRNDAEQLVLVEGELNSLSLAALEPFATVISPGGAGDFYSSRGQKELTDYARLHNRIDIVVDADAAGAQAAIETKAKLMVLGCPDVRVHLVERDFNQILCDEGKEALREECKRLGLL